MIQMHACNTFTNIWRMGQLADVLVVCLDNGTNMTIYMYVFQHSNVCSSIPMY